MAQTTDQNVKYCGRCGQMLIYLRRAFRLCVTQSDWKVLPMSALIAGLVTYVIGGTIFVNQERTLLGAFALACVGIWNGCFNSIQSVCRERAILKREHRAGMHISSYIIAQMIYQATLCLAQSIIMTLIFYFSKVHFPAGGTITPWFAVDFTITLFLITFAADMLALLVSCFVHSPTTAMTIMPFLLIFELVFSGGVIPVSGKGAIISEYTIANWSLTAITAQGHYNELPLVSAWKQLKTFEDVEAEGGYPVKEVINYMEENDKVEPFQLYCGQKNAKEKYACTQENILTCWLVLLLKALLYVALAGGCLELIDRDKR